MNHPPGIELDILIAEKVMGLEVVKTKSGSKRGGYYYSIGEPDWMDFSGDMQLSNRVPAYSEDIAAAWEVVEKLHRDAFSVHLDTSEVGPGIGGVDVKIVCQAQARGRFYAEADTAPHAICLAALKTVEGK